MNMTAVITRLTELFLILALGYAGNKTKILNAGSNRLLTALILNITMPCTILGSVMNGDVTATGFDALRFILFTLVYFALSFLIVWPLPRLFRKKNDPRRSDDGILRFLVLFGNVGFMGYPVIQSIYGSGALFYVTLFNIPFNLLLFSVGIILSSGKREKLNLKLFLTPTLFATLAAIAVYAFRLNVPAIIVGSVSLLGNVTTPGAMLVIGSTLAEIPMREVFTDLRVYPVAFIKLAVVPVITWLALRFFITDAHTLGVLVVEAAMPAATAATMLSLRYGGNDKLASKGVFITTLLSVITIPLLLYILF
jgi:predicted permease